ncbi:MAG: hypothetical protein ACK4PI_07135 [Tepidisphaerales bacterium]
MAVDTKHILTVVKKNWLSIASAAVAVVAVAVPFVLADGWMSETQTALEQRRGVARTIEDIGRKNRSLPQLDPDATERQPLEMFPSRSVIAAGKAALDHLDKQGNLLLEEALKLNVRRPLMEDVFRATPQQYRGAAFRFRDEYLAFMTRQESPSPRPDGLSVMVRGGVPFSAEQIQRFIMAERERIQRERGIRSGGNLVNADEIARLISEAERKLPEQLRNEVALSNQVYLSPDTWMVDPNMAPSVQPPMPEAVWFAQLGLWIQQEAARIVLAANEGSANVFSSPVKHLVAVRYVPFGQGGGPFGPYIMPAGGGSSDAGGDGGGGFGMPAAPTGPVAPLTGKDPSSPINLARGAFLTGRQACGLYDVVHFNMVVRVAESKVAEFLATIPRGRLVNVLNVQMQAVDSAVESAAGYIYGNDPVVQLEVECEMIMLRAWTTTLMPPRVRTLLGVESAVAATP